MSSRLSTPPGCVPAYRGWSMARSTGDVLLVEHTNRVLHLAGLNIRVSTPEAALGALSKTSVIVAACERLLGGPLGGVSRHPRTAEERAQNLDLVLRELAYAGGDIQSIDCGHVAQGHRAACAALAEAVCSFAASGRVAGRSRRDAADQPGGGGEHSVRAALEQVNEVLARFEARRSTSPARAFALVPEQQPPLYPDVPVVAPPRVPRPPLPTPPSTFVSAETRAEREARAARVAASRMVYAAMPPPPPGTPKARVAVHTPVRPASAEGGRRRRSLLTLLPYRTHGAAPGRDAYPHHTPLPSRPPSRMESASRRWEQADAAAPLADGARSLPPELAVHLARLAQLQLSEEERLEEAKRRVEAATAAAVADAERRVQERQRLLGEHLRAVEAANQHAAQKAAAAAERNAAAAARAAAAREAAAREDARGTDAVLARAQERRFRQQFLAAVAAERRRVQEARHEAVADRQRTAYELQLQQHNMLDAQDEAWNALLDRVAAAQASSQAAQAAELNAEYDDRRYDRQAQAAVSAYS